MAPGPPLEGNHLGVDGARQGPCRCPWGPSGRLVGVEPGTSQGLGGVAQLRWLGGPEGWTPPSCKLRWSQGRPSEPRSRPSSSHVWPMPAIRLLSTRGGPCLEGPLATGTVASSFFTLCHECTCEAEPKGRGPRPPSRYVLVTCDLGPWPSLGSSPRPPGCGEPAIEGLCSLLSPLRLGSCAGGCWVFSSHLEIKIAL